MHELPYTWLSPIEWLPKGQPNCRSHKRLGCASVYQVLIVIFSLLLGRNAQLSGEDSGVFRRKIFKT